MGKPTEKNPLGTDADGNKVIATTLVVQKTGDGLSQAMATENRLIARGERFYIVMECVNHTVSFPAEERKHPEIGGVIRKHIADADTVAFIDGDLVSEVLEAQAEKNRRLAEQNAGVARLNIEGTAQENARAEHTLAAHDGAFDECEICKRAIEDEIAEAAE